MNFVVNMLARPKKIKVAQMPVKDVEKAMETYLKNSFVCLSSVNRYNPTAQCLLAIDFELGETWKARFARYGIRLVHVPFGGFKISENFDWDIVQYRYDVMHYLCENLSNEDTVVMLDTDVVCVDSLQEVFEETQDALCLFDVQHRISNPDRKNIIENYKKLFPERESYNLIHWGGEFIGAKIPLLKKLLTTCTSVAQTSKTREDLVNFNDEHITSIAVNLLKEEVFVKNANAYIYRYWTGAFYLVSTNWQNNPVVLWHLPVEKTKGILKIYNHLLRKDKMPSKKTLARYCSLPKLPLKIKCRLLAKKLLKK